MSMFNNIKQEKRAFKTSILANLFMTVIALYYGLKVNSEAIKLDGYYSFAGLILAIVSLWIVKIVSKPESLKFNFGYSSFEPLFNLVKGIMILGVALSSLSLIHI